MIWVKKYAQDLASWSYLVKQGHEECSYLVQDPPGNRAKWLTGIDKTSPLDCTSTRLYQLRLDQSENALESGHAQDVRVLSLGFLSPQQRAWPRAECSSLAPWWVRRRRRRCYVHPCLAC
jgi:hypothetical protein